MFLQKICQAICGTINPYKANSQAQDINFIRFATHNATGNFVAISGWYVFVKGIAIKQKGKQSFFSMHYLLVNSFFLDNIFQKRLGQNLLQPGRFQTINSNLGGHFPVKSMLLATELCALVGLKQIQISRTIAATLEQVNQLSAQLKLLS